MDGCPNGVHILRVLAEVDSWVVSEFWQKAIVAAVPLLVGAVLGLFGWFHAEISEKFFGAQKRLVAAATTFSEPMVKPLDQSKDQVLEMIEFGEGLLPELGKLQATTDIQLLAQKIRSKLIDLRHVRELLDFEIKAEKLLEGRESAGAPELIVAEINEMDKRYLNTPTFMRPDNSRPYLLRQKIIGLRTELRKVPSSASPAAQASAAAEIIGLGSANETPVDLLPKIQTFAAAVGQVYVSFSSGSNTIGLGFLIGDAILLTAHHVLASAEEARRAKFQVTGETQSDPKSIDAFTLDPESLFVSSEDLDYSLVAVRPTSDRGALLSHYGTIDLRAIPNKILAGESVSTIYLLPENRKVLAWRSGAVLKIIDQFLWYDYAAFGPLRRFGISGAPLFNAAWEPIAMVHSGVPKRDSQGRILRRDGKALDQGDGEDEIDWIAREGVLLSSIVADAKKKLGGLSPLQRQLDVVLLHQGILEPALGVTPRAVAAESNLSYEREFVGAIEAVDRGAQVAFLLNSVDVDVVMKVATSGEVMPQKSTDFYPKLLSGITMYRVGE